MVAANQGVRPGRRLLGESPVSKRLHAPFGVNVARIGPIAFRRGCCPLFLVLADDLSTFRFYCNSRSSSFFKIAPDLSVTDLFRLRNLPGALPLPPGCRHALDALIAQLAHRCRCKVLTESLLP